MTSTHYRIGALAQLAGVTVRALHHYDQVGLLVPSGRSARNYRLYTRDDLLRLQQILLGRELGMSLEDIRAMLDDPGFDHRRALLEQRRQLEARVEDTKRMINAIDAALGQLTTPGDIDMNPENLFDGFDPKPFEAEAKARWGDTTEYAEAARRTKRYDKAAWQQIHAEEAAIVSGLAALASAGTPPESAAARELAERHRLHIDRWYYPCSHTMHTRLAELYTADARFAAHFDKHGEGVATYVVAAIQHNAAQP
ncbi:MerR family transcriptional regulator [Enhygromyxa salina]|uniref:HTH-type transcriptional activator TipA n=1 Tax=Enhygromyxa salina TaxID=215803 RepID=A0A2S9YWF8_9BACT|nr:MerR family transcriptional regulator [Enhygromyxa salina]PRQ09413.1 HTH-type transcriptional activator TipA [Enhygromyxa salina]